jgi:hypothetical protein
MKVVGIGMPKTGTTTLGTCLKKMGFKHISWVTENMNLFKAGQYKELLEIASNYDSFDDLPWCQFYQTIDENFPNCKFILTTRKDEITYFNSYRKHRSRLVKGILLNTTGEDFEKAIHEYREHNEKARRYFANRPDDFIELCWENGDGWKELSQFLGKKAPQIAFPHTNKTDNEKANKKIFKIRMKKILGSPFKLLKRVTR